MSEKKGKKRRWAAWQQGIADWSCIYMLENSSCETMSNPSHLRCSAICSGTSLNLRRRVSKRNWKKMRQARTAMLRNGNKVAGDRGGGYYMMQLTMDSAPSHFTSEKRVVA